jgi:hypothetical protein
LLDAKTGGVYFGIKMNNYKSEQQPKSLSKFAMSLAQINKELVPWQAMEGQLYRLGTTSTPNSIKVPGKTDMVTAQIEYTMKQEKGNNPMYMNATTPLDIQQKQYLTERARTVYYDLEHKLYNQFFINYDEKPKNKAELVDRITKGLFMIRSDAGDLIAASDWDDDEDEVSYGFLGNIVWRDPAKKADFAGKDEAAKALSKQYTLTKDIIMVSDAATGLKAIQDLEAWVPSNLPS